MNRDDQRIINSFSKTLELINQLQKANGAELNQQHELLIWRSAAEAEYLAFLIATIHRLNDFTPVADKGLTLSADVALSLIEKARGLLSSNPRLAYVNVRKTVSILRGMSTNERRIQRAHSPPPKNG